MLREGDTVEYEAVYDDRKGKYRADRVTGGRREEESRGGGGYGGGGRDRYDDRRGMGDRRGMRACYAISANLANPPCAHLFLSTLSLTILCMMCRFPAL